MSDELFTSLAGVVNLWLAGKCPPVLGEFVASAPLTLLLKPDGGIRPIAIGTIWRRLCSKLAASSVCKAMTTYLGDHQFGVGFHVGEKVLCTRPIDYLNSKEVRSKCPSIAKWVEFCYTHPARLYYGESTLSSAQGVQQGDPLGPLLFALTLHPLVSKIATQCTLDLHAWYLDDGTIIGDTLEVSKALNIIQNEGGSRGLFLNINKTEVFWPTPDPRSFAEVYFRAILVEPMGELCFWVDPQP